MMARDVYGDNTSWNSEDSGLTHADHVDICNIPAEITKQILLDFIIKKDISIRENQLVQNEEDPTKWRLTGLLPQEIECLMMLVNKSKIGKDGKTRIECYPAMTSTPVKAGEAAAATDGPTGEDLAEAMRNLVNGEEVSPNTNVANGSNVQASVLKSANLSSQSAGSGSDDDDFVDVNSGSDTDEDCKVVDADGDTLPPKGNGVAAKMVLTKKDGNYEAKMVQTGTKEKPKAKDQKEAQRRTASAGRRNSVSGGNPNSTLGVRTPTLAAQTKARATLKQQLEAAKVEAERAQEEARLKSEKANATMDKTDIKAAEKADREAAKAKSKMMLTQSKYDDCIRTQDELKQILGKGKRVAETQSPNKDDGNDEDGTKVQNSKEKKKEAKDAKNAKKKTKTQAELDLQKSFFES